MYLFVVVALSVYTLMHLVVYWGVKPLLAGHWAASPVVLAIFALMILSPVAVRMLERDGGESAARAVAWVGFTWMGFIFLAFSLFSVLGVGEALLRAIGRFTGGSISLHGPATSIAVLLVATVTGLYGMLEAHNLSVERVRIETPKLPRGAMVKIAQVSDIHLGLMSHEEVLAPILAVLEGEKPDLLLSTGDMLDAQLNHVAGLAKLWEKFKPPLGKYAILGNHEYYAGLPESIKFHVDSGFRVLRNEIADVGPIAVAGEDDHFTGDEAKMLAGADGKRFLVFMKHKPLVDAGSEGLFDLQLSGHTHGGQIFPFRYITARQFPMLAGLFTLEKGSRLYVSRGTGAWGPPMRVGARPEITLFEIAGTGPAGKGEGS